MQLAAKVFSGFLLLLVCQLAYSCRCSNSTFEELVQSSEGVYTVRFDEVSTHVEFDDGGYAGDPLERHQGVVVEVWKGKRLSQLIAYTIQDGASSCSFSLDKNREYLVLVPASGRLVLTLCSFSSPICGLPAHWREIIENLHDREIDERSTSGTVL